MFNIFKRKPQPRVVSVRKAPDADQLRPDIDVPTFMRRTPEQQKAVNEMWMRTRIVLQRNRGILVKQRDGF